MTWLETLRTAYDSLRTRRLRSALTMLGILIGIAAVMLTVGLGQGAQKQVTDQINKLGSNLLIVTPGSTTSSSGVRGGRGSATTLTSDDAAVLADPSVAPDIARVAPTSGGSQSLVAGTTTWTSNVVATNAEWLGVRARSVAQGRFFTADEVTSESSVAVLGSTTAAQLLGSTNAVGQTITVGGQNVTVIGVLNTEGSTTGGDQDDLVVMPLTTYASRLSTSANPRSVSTIYIEAKDATSLSAAYQETTNALLSAHGVTLATQELEVLHHHLQLRPLGPVLGVVPLVQLQTPFDVQRVTLVDVLGQHLSGLAPRFAVNEHDLLPLLTASGLVFVVDRQPEPADA